MTDESKAVALLTNNGGSVSRSGGSEKKLDNGGGDDAPPKKRERKSRWQEDRGVVMGMPTMLPAHLNDGQRDLYVVQLRIEQISGMLRTGDMQIPKDARDRSPSPEPIYNQSGQRLNTREVRKRKELEQERHDMVAKAWKMNPSYVPPQDYKAQVIKFEGRVPIPQDDHPDINFVGLIIGPRGHTLKQLESETGCKIIIRGKGSVKEGKFRSQNQQFPGEDEDLHAFLTAHDNGILKNGLDKIETLIKQAIENPSGENSLRRRQLQELAILNGTLKDDEGLRKLRDLAEAGTITTNKIICTRCGAAGHIERDCKQPAYGYAPALESFHDIEKMDSEYTALMEELGAAPKGIAVSKPKANLPTPLQSGQASESEMLSLSQQIEQNTGRPTGYGVQTSHNALVGWEGSGGNAGASQPEPKQEFYDYGYGGRGGGRFHGGGGGRGRGGYQQDGGYQQQSGYGGVAASQYYPPPPPPSHGGAAPWQQQQQYPYPQQHQQYQAPYHGQSGYGQQSQQQQHWAGYQNYSMPGYLPPPPPPPP